MTPSYRPAFVWNPRGVKSRLKLTKNLVNPHFSGGESSAMQHQINTKLDRCLASFNLHAGVQTKLGRKPCESKFQTTRKQSREQKQMAYEKLREYQKGGECRQQRGHKLRPYKNKVPYRWGKTATIEMRRWEEDSVGEGEA